jgi:hypothetical protein
MAADDFPSVSLIAEQLSGFDRPWMVAGGWAIDLYLGRATRPHKDVEIAIFRDDQLDLRTHLAGWTFDYMTRVPERPRAAWAEGMWLSAPIHEIWAAPAELGPVEHPGAHPLALEILLNERSADAWLFRKEPTVQLPIPRAIVQTASGIPVLAPEAVLLYKSGWTSGICRDVDDADFAHTAPLLPPDARTWLHQAIARGNPNHRWLRQL